MISTWPVVVYERLSLGRHLIHLGSQVFKTLKINLDFIIRSGRDVVDGLLSGESC